MTGLIDLTPHLPENNSKVKIQVGNYEYNADQKLGQGSFGTVFRGCKSFDRLPVALKKVPSAMLRDIEIESPTSTKCPYFVDCIDVVDVMSEGSTYVVLELCDMDLRKFLQLYKRLDDRNLDLLAKCLAEGYNALSGQGIVHRDIKPENIMLKLDNWKDSSETEAHHDSDDDEGIVFGQPVISVAKLGDFGCCRKTPNFNNNNGNGNNNNNDNLKPIASQRISKSDQEIDRIHNLAGTADYMAPEVGANTIQALNYGPEVDLWSIGVVLFECSEGLIPFDERQMCKIFLKAATGIYDGYQAPQAKMCSKKYTKIIEVLLSLNPALRLTAQDLHDLVFEHFDRNPKLLIYSSRNDDLLVKSRNKSTGDSSQSDENWFSKLAKKFSTKK